MDSNIDDYVDLPRRTLDSVDVSELEKKYIDEILRWSRRSNRGRRIAAGVFAAAVSLSVGVSLYAVKFQGPRDTPEPTVVTPTIESVIAEITSTPTVAPTYTPTDGPTYTPQPTATTNPTNTPRPTRTPAPTQVPSKYIYAGGHVVWWSSSSNYFNDDNNHYIIEFPEVFQPGSQATEYAIWTDEDKAAFISRKGIGSHWRINTVNIDGSGFQEIFQSAEGGLDTIAYDGSSIYTTYTLFEGFDPVWYLVNATTGQVLHKGDGTNPDKVYVTRDGDIFLSGDWGLSHYIYNGSLRSTESCPKVYDQTVWPYEILDGCDL